MNREPATCPSCGGLLPEPPAPVVCGQCGWQAIPHPSEWSRELKALLWDRYFTQNICSPSGNDAEGWRRMLTSAYRGTTVSTAAGARSVKWAATAEECYAIAMHELESRRAAAPEGR